MFNNPFFGDPRISKRFIEQYLSNYIGVPINLLKFSRLTEKPSIWKHSCVLTGVVLPKPIVIPMVSQYTTIEITFIYCNACNKVVYYYED